MSATLESTLTVIGVRFFRVGKLYHFDSSYFPELKVGDRAIVETQRGPQMGEVVKFVENPAPPEGGYKSIERIATPRELTIQKQWQAKELEAMINCRERAAQLRLSIKIVKAEYNYDGSRLSFFMGASGDDRDRDEKIDTKSLQADMQKLYPATRAELRQIGPRDVAKLIGGAGAGGVGGGGFFTFLTPGCPSSVH